MKGFPLQNLIAVLLALAALAVPLWRVDRPGPLRPAREAGASGAAGAVPELPVQLRLRFVHAPLRTELTVQGKPVPLRGEGGERLGDSVLTGRGQELEMELKATWPPGTPGTMVEIGAAPDGLAEQVRNVWAEGAAADEVVRFNWRVRP